MEPLIISGQNLQIDDVVAVARGRKVMLDTAVLPAVNRSRQAVETLVREGQIAYGITTGFGRFKDKFINADQSLQLQLNLVRSHAVGTGPILARKDVRAMLLARANTLAQGYSGVRPVIIQTLLDMLNAGIHPRVPAQGSLGASGDLAPLAHLALPLIGEGEAFYNGEMMPGAEAMRAAGVAPLVLQAKEGLALLNGTAFMVGLGAMVVRRAVNLALTADIAAALTLEALRGTDRAYDDRVHQLRPHPRQIECAAFLRQILAGSEMLRPATSTMCKTPTRCVVCLRFMVRCVILLPMRNGC